MGLNTYPYNPFPASTDKLDESHNEQIQAEIDQLNSDLTDLSEEVKGDATVYPYADVITIENAVPANLADCSVKIEPVQSGSGDPSPTNVRPITGHTEASVEVTDGDETTNTYTIALGDTIYGGTVDFDSGVMTVTHKYVDLGDYTWSYNGNNQFFTSGINDFAKDPIVGANEFAKYCICEKYKVAKSVQSDAYLALYYNTSYSGYRCFVLNDPNTEAMEYGSEFKTYITGTHICYELATPTTIQLTPRQIQLLKGTNTLTASTGQISVTVNGVADAIGAVQEQVNATNEAVAELTADIAEQLPTAPTTDGAYVLTVTVESGTPTYSWESAE